MRKELTFEIGEKVFLKVAPMKEILRVGKKGKLSPRFIGPFEILEKIGSVAYHLALPPELSAVHNVFHISMLRKYIPDSNHVVNVQSLDVQSDMTYEKASAVMLERKDHALRNQKVPLVKVQWSKHDEDEATWEREDDILAKYPNLIKTILALSPLEFCVLESQGGFILYLALQHRNGRKNGVLDEMSMVQLSFHGSKAT
ncbi:uncharacterized protein LOC111400441 [Olea europaea var. sylvestris]|uniref:uncharacterized protein LOC111400441 n=1 Tax=Olea europaea var. sylvestris TaxID=158386 RepID=UPI000C1D343D|nr:uncharacterized protein LOC111400441 [Olea europaea var. sylvestris]